MFHPLRCTCLYVDVDPGWIVVADVKRKVPEYGKGGRTSWIDTFRIKCFNSSAFVLCWAPVIFTCHCITFIVIRLFIITLTCMLISSIIALASECATLYARCSAIASASAVNTLCLCYKNDFFDINACITENKTRKVVIMATRAWLSHPLTWRVLYIFMVIVYLYLKFSVIIAIIMY